MNGDKSNQKIWYHIKNYKFNSLVIKVFLGILYLIIVPVMIVNLIVYWNTASALVDEVNTVSINSLYRVRDILDAVFKEVDLLAGRISLDDDVETFMSSTTAQGLTDSTYKNIDKMVRTYTAIYQYVDSIYVYSENRHFIFSSFENTITDQFTDSNWMQEYGRRQDGSTWYQLRKCNDIYPYVISSIRPIYGQNNQKLGSIIINIDVEELGQLVSGTGNGVTDQFFITDRYGTIVFSQDTDKITKNMRTSNLLTSVTDDWENYSMVKNIEGHQYIVFQLLSNQMDWRYISFIPLLQFQQKIIFIRNFLISFFLISIVLAVIFSFIVSIKAFAPVKDIIGFFNTHEEQLKRFQLKDTEHMDEVKYIAGNILKMIHSSELLKNELNSRMKLLDRAQTVALQAQINPHFLYNTLEAINWTALRLLKGGNEVSAMIMDLSKLLRISLESDEYLIPISKEIEHAECFVKIMNIRYDEEFHIVWEIDKDLYRCKIIKMCFQPLIENAIYHGFKAGAHKGTIWIGGCALESSILIEVIDDGVGMTTDQVKMLNQNLSIKYDINQEHIGIQNVNQRIKLIFGEEYGIMVDSIEGQGTIVKILLPAKF